MARPHTGAPASPTVPLLAFVGDTPLRSGCELLRVEGGRDGSFRLAFEDPLLQHSGLVGRLFGLQRHGRDSDGARMTLRPPASPDDAHHARDPFRVFTSVLLGVAPARYFNEEAPLPISISAAMELITLERGWYSWLREDCRLPRGRHVQKKFGKMGCETSFLSKDGTTGSIREGVGYAADRESR